MDKYGFPNPKEHEEWKAQAVKQAVDKHKREKPEEYYNHNYNKSTAYSYNDVIIQAYQKKIMEDLMNKPVFLNYEKPGRKQISLLD
jgi:hypothetical protein